MLWLPESWVLKIARAMSRRAPTRASLAA
jgi:hypothetical protein